MRRIFQNHRCVVRENIAEQDAVQDHTETEDAVEVGIVQLPAEFHEARQFQDHAERHADPEKIRQPAPKEQGGK